MRNKTILFSVKDIPRLSRAEAGDPDNESAGLGSKSGMGSRCAAHPTFSFSWRDGR